MVLRTKLFRPKPPPTYLHRPRLLTQLDAGQHSDLTLVAAPAGYGKTTVIAAWLAQHSELASCWVALDERDNDPIIFWRYVVAALRMISAEVGNAAEQALQLGAELAIESVVLSLINDLWLAYQSHGQQWVLVLDDYHLIHTPAIHESLDLLIENMPAEALRVVMTTRSDPPLSLARRRARQQLCELRVADLRFRADEIRALVNDRLGLSLSAESIQHLTQRTEGWIAALQLTALSLRGEADPQAFVAALAKNNRFVADYLTEEVVAHQPSAVQTFLMQSACLLQFSAELLNTLFPSSDTATILHDLESKNLFLVPLDATHTRFRYHHLFADLLLQRQSAADKQATVATLRGASVWHAEQREWELAIEYALRADDADLIADHILRAAYPNPHHETVRLHWFSYLSDAQYVAQPGLHIINALLLVYVPKSDAIENAVKQLALAAERFDFDSQASPDPYWLGQLQVYQATVNMLHEPSDPQGDIEKVEAAIAQFGGQYPFLQARSIYQLGWLKLAVDDQAAAVAAFEKAITASQLTQDNFIYMQALSALWGLNGAQRISTSDQLRRVDHFIATSPLVARQYPLTAAAFRVRGQLLLQLGRFTEAVEALETGLKLIILTSEYGQEFLIRWGLARALSGVGKRDAALAIADSIEERAPYFGQISISLRRWLRQWQYGKERGISAELNSWFLQKETLLAQEIGPIQSLPQTIFLREVVLCGRLMMWQSELAQLPAVIDKLGLFNEVKLPHPGWQLPIFINIAIFYAAMGDTAEADRQLREALKIAEPLEFMGVFCEPRGLALSLLRGLRERGGAGPWLDAVIEQVQQVEALRVGNAVGISAETATPTLTALAAGTLLDPLTERELEILQLIAEGMTNKQIAGRLFLSPNTVRVHNSNIYSKLDVPNRTQAASKARALGLLADSSDASS